MRTTRAADAPRGRPRFVRAALACAASLAGPGCMMTLENVTYQRRGATFPGHAVEYVQATPEPGTLLAEGSAVRFTVEVRYVLQVADRGRIFLGFRDHLERELVPGQPVALDVERSRTRTVTLSKLVEVPAVHELFLHVSLLPEGVREPAGVLRIRYPVRWL